jgi:hypothetical protein
MLYDVRFQVLMVVSMKFRIFWSVVQYSHVEVDQRFRVAYCLHQGPVRISEMSVNVNMTTQRYIAEVAKLQCFMNTANLKGHERKIACDRKP